METGAAMRSIDAPDRDGERARDLLSDLRPRLLRLALALGAHPDDADDLVQETLLAAHRNRSRFDAGAGSVRGWLATILIRRMHNRRRSWNRRVRFLSSIRRESAREIGSGAEAVEARLTLARLLEALTERQREVVALYELGEMSAEESARALGLTPAGVRSIARDARRRLAEAAAEIRTREVSR